MKRDADKSNDYEKIYQNKIEQINNELISLREKNSVL